MLKLLLDANLSPETAKFFRRKGLNVKSIQEEKLGKLADKEIVELAIKEERIVVTLDLDFGELWYFVFKGKTGIIVLRTKFQTVEWVNKILEKFLKERFKEGMEKSLIVLSESGFRITS